jgi:hypothetical protein
LPKKQNSQLSSQGEGLAEQKVLGEFEQFLEAKRVFLDARKQVIEELKQCLSVLENKLGKNAVVSEAGSAISNVAGSLSLPAHVVTFGIPKAVGEAIKSGSNFSKIVLTQKGSEAFQFSLGDKEGELTQLEEVYSSLKNNQEVSGVVKDILEVLGDKLFDAKYEVFDILFKDGV